jgi:hypothetical protein
MTKPTDQAYDELQQAYDYFNDQLFAGELPPCLITLQRKPQTLGYYTRNSFASLTEHGRTTDEIALNPNHFIGRSLQDTLSTLVHEMAHLWRDRCSGKNPPRRAYHDKLWADKMQKVGLMPSDTGQLGGKRTGQTVDHYIITNGPFDSACRTLLDRGFRISWADNAMSFLIPDLYETPPLPDTETASEMPVPASASTSFAIAQPKNEGRSGKRSKYTCPACGLNAWAKPDAALMCGTCEETMHTADEE